MKLQRRPSSPSCRLIDSLYHVGGPHPRRALFSFAFTSAPSQTC